MWLCPNVNQILAIICISFSSNRFDRLQCRDHMLSVNKDYHLSSSLLLEINFREGGRPCLTHHIKIPLGGHGSVRRKAVEVKQREQDWCASAAGDGARALKQTTQTLWGCFPQPGTDTAVHIIHSTGLPCRSCYSWHHNIINQTSNLNTIGYLPEIISCKQTDSLKPLLS